MDDEFPPPFPGNFVHEADTSESHFHEEEHEQNYGHIPLPEIEHSELPLPVPISKTISPKIVPNGVISEFPPPINTELPEHQPEEMIKEISQNGEEISGFSREKEIEESAGTLTNGHLSSPTSESVPIIKQEESVISTQEEKSIELMARDQVDTEQQIKIYLKDEQELKVLEASTVEDAPSQMQESSATVEDDWDDAEFGDFAETNVTSECPPQEPAAAPVTNIVTEDDDDEWGAFDKAPRRDSHLASTASIDDDDGFGAFGAASLSAEETKFEATESWTPQFVESPRETAADAENWEEALLQKVVEIKWESEDYDETCFSQEEIVEISSILRPAPFGLESEDCVLRRSFELWCLLRIVEEAKSLRYVFDGSTLATNHYKKINIDKNNINKANLTTFSADSILTPTPVNGSVLNPSTPSSETVKPIIPEKEVTPPTDAPSGAFDSLSAPPAEFDWDKSGLTNPLKGTKSSALLDMDFLSSNTASTSGVSTLQKDLAAFGLNSPEPSKRKSEKSILDTILSSAATTQTNYKPVAELSLDARALHDQLPDISCLLQTKVMLPFGGQSF